MDINEIIKKIFLIKNETEFNELSLQIFNFQYNNNKIYNKFVNLLNIDISKIKHYTKIPFLPIEFFKKEKIITGNGNYQIIFESSGTISQNTSKHYIKDIKLYEKSFLKTFHIFYGRENKYSFLFLLPSYLERKNSSLIYMANKLIEKSRSKYSNFFLYEYEKLFETLKILEKEKIKTILFGVSFALLDFASKFPLNLRNTIIMETGGMKGRRKEISREELHEKLKKYFNVNSIHSEYGMTEMLSQAYSYNNGLFFSPPWLKILVRDIYNPLKIYTTKSKGAINIIDLANIYSCSFIATDDLGYIIKPNIFKITGRKQGAEQRGCNLIFD